MYSSTRTTIFFYLQDTDGPLRLPTVDPATGEVISDTARQVGGADGLFEPERDHVRVTGNDVASNRPTKGDWYETVKLNYGYNFRDRDAPTGYPSSETPNRHVPDTWRKMDAIIAYWQEFGVDGFRVDMAHLVPPEFWSWLIGNARERESDVFFVAEAYADDPAKVLSREPRLRQAGVMAALLDAGFNAVYDDATYDTLHGLYDTGRWANDVEDVAREMGELFFERALRYAENHDEVRLANPSTWGGLDAAREFKVSSMGMGDDGAKIVFPVVPGHQYRVLASSTMAAGSWTEVATFTAESGDDYITIEDAGAGDVDARFYIIEALD